MGEWMGGVCVCVCGRGEGRQCEMFEGKWRVVIKESFQKHL